MCILIERESCRQTRWTGVCNGEMACRRGGLIAQSGQLGQCAAAQGAQLPRRYAQACSSVCGLERAGGRGREKVGVHEGSCCSHDGSGQAGRQARQRTPLPSCQCLHHGASPAVPFARVSRRPALPCRELVLGTRSVLAAHTGREVSRLVRPPARWSSSPRDGHG